MTFYIIYCFLDFYNCCARRHINTFSFNNIFFCITNEMEGRRRFFLVIDITKSIVLKNAVIHINDRRAIII